VVLIKSGGRDGIFGCLRIGDIPLGRGALFRGYATYLFVRVTLFWFF